MHISQPNVYQLYNAFYLIHLNQTLNKEFISVDAGGKKNKHKNIESACYTLYAYPELNYTGIKKGKWYFQQILVSSNMIQRSAQCIGSPDCYRHRALES